LPVKARQWVSIVLSSEVVRTLEAVTNPGNRSAFIERSIRRELPGIPLKEAEAVEQENLGNSQNLRDEHSETTQQLRNVGKRKAPADLLGLIPSESPILQT
jgi:hypothetical protein